MRAHQRMRGEVVAGREARQVRSAHGNRIDVMTGKPGVAAEKLALVALMKVEADAGLIVVIGANDSGRVDIGRDVTERIERGYVGGDRVDGLSGDLIIGKFNAAGREVDQGMVEFSLVLIGCRHGGRGCDAGAVAEAFVVRKYEKAVFTERSAQPNKSKRN